MGETGTETTEGERGSDDDGVADLGCGVECCLGGGDGKGMGSRDVDFWRIGDQWTDDARKRGSRLTVQSLNEQVSVLTDFKSPDRGTEHLDAQSLEDTHLVELNTDVQSTLSTESEQDTVRSFLFEHVGDIVGRNG